MQARAAEDLARLIAEALAPLSPSGPADVLRPAPHRPGGAGGCPGCREPDHRTRTARQRAATGAGRFPAQARRHAGPASPGRRLLGGGQGGGCGVGGGADRRRHPASAAPLPLAEIDALGGDQRLHLGAAAAADRLSAGRRGCAVRPARGRRRRARPRRSRPDRGPPLPRPRRLRRARLRRLGGQAARPPRAGRCRRTQAHHRRRHRRPGRRTAAQRGGRSRLARRGRRAGGMAGAAARAHRRRTHGPAAGGHAGLHAGQPALFRAAHRRRPAPRRGSPSSPMSRPRTAAPPSSPATNACCARASPMRGISGTWTARPGWKPACRGWSMSRSTPSSAARATGCGGCSAWRP